MRKWMSTLVAVAVAAAAGLVIRQVAQDLSDNAHLWRSVTDDPAGV